MKQFRFYFIFLILFKVLITNTQKVSRQDSLFFEELVDSIQKDMRNNLSLGKNKLFNLQKISKWQNDPYTKSVIINVLGTIYYKEFQLDSAKYYFEKALIIREKYGFKANLATTYEDISNLHSDIGEDSIAMGYLYRSLAIKEEINNPKYLAPIYSEIGNWHYKQSNFDSSLLYYYKGLEIFEKNNDSLQLAKTAANIGNVFFMQDKNDEAIQKFRFAFTMAKSRNDSIFAASTLYNIGGIYDWTKNNDSAIYYFNEAKNHLENTGSKSILGEIYQALAEVYIKDQNIDSSLRYFKTYISFRDSVFKSDKVASLMEFETKYKTKEKEQALLVETTKNKEKQRTILFLALSILGLFVTLIFVYRFFRQKRKVNTLEVSVKNQKIDSLLKEQESNTYIALLQGQQEERQRISQDLHDRIGGTLAAIKVHFGLVIEEENNDNNYDKLVELVDEAAKDVRNISHDLASGKLISHGLKSTLTDLVKTVNSSKVISFNMFMKDDITFKNDHSEQEIYSIIQELLGNTLKHANATNIDLNINLQGNLVNILFEDDGSGFHLENLKNEGLGLSGIRSRITKLGGDLDIDSTIGRGSIFNINIPLG